MNNNFELPQEWIDHLVALPESGMGYQVVDVIFTDGSSIESCVVSNAQYLDIPSSYHTKAISNIKIHEGEHE
jgi:hypothetical protein